MGGQAPEQERTECRQHEQMNNVRRFDARDTSGVILAQADLSFPAKILAGKGQREDAATDGKKELDTVMTGFKGLGDKSAGARFRFGIVPEMKQADRAHVVSDYRHNGDESQAIDLRDEVPTGGRDAGEASQKTLAHPKFWIAA